MSRIDGGYPAPEQADQRPSSDRDGAAPSRRSPTRGGATRWIIPVGIAACYALLTLAVHRRLLDDLDLAIRDVYRPENVWGPLQIRPTVSSSLKGRGFVNGLSTSGFLAFGLRVGGTG